MPYNLTGSLSPAVGTVSALQQDARMGLPLDAKQNDAMALAALKAFRNVGRFVSGLQRSLNRGNTPNAPRAGVERGPIPRPRDDHPVLKARTTVQAPHGAAFVYRVAQEIPPGAPAVSELGLDISTIAGDGVKGMRMLEHFASSVVPHGDLTLRYVWGNLCGSVMDIGDAMNKDPDQITFEDLTAYVKRPSAMGGSVASTAREFMKKILSSSTLSPRIGRFVLAHEGAPFQWRKTDATGHTIEPNALYEISERDRAAYTIPEDLRITHIELTRALWLFFKEGIPATWNGEDVVEVLGGSHRWMQINRYDSVIPLEASAAYAHALCKTFEGEGVTVATLDGDDIRQEEQLRSMVGDTPGNCSSLVPMRSDSGEGEHLDDAIRSVADEARRAERPLAATSFSCRVPYEDNNEGHDTNPERVGLDEDPFCVLRRALGFMRVGSKFMVYSSALFIPRADRTGLYDEDGKPTTLAAALALLYAHLQPGLDQFVGDATVGLEGKNRIAEFRSVDGRRTFIVLNEKGEQPITLRFPSAHALEATKWYMYGFVAPETIDLPKGPSSSTHVVHIQPGSALSLRFKPEGQGAVEQERHIRVPKHAPVEYKHEASKTGKERKRMRAMVAEEKNRTSHRRMLQNRTKDEVSRVPTKKASEQRPELFDVKQDQWNFASLVWDHLSLFTFLPVVLVLFALLNGRFRR